jgi:hypothetical protein
MWRYHLVGGIYKNGGMALHRTVAAEGSLSMHMSKLCNSCRTCIVLWTASLSRTSRSISRDVKSYCSRGPLMGNPVLIGAEEYKTHHSCNQLILQITWKM